MGLLTIFLTIVLVLDCLLLTLLVLIQLPKKEAGMGQAFGGAATDALFGAGSGNALTKMTKYATGAFLVLTLSLAVINNHQARKSGILFDKYQASQPAPDVTPPVVVPSKDTNAGLKMPDLPSAQAKATNATNSPSAGAPAK